MIKLDDIGIREVGTNSLGGTIYEGGVKLGFGFTVSEKERLSSIDYVKARSIEGKFLIMDRIYGEIKRHLQENRNRIVFDSENTEKGCFAADFFEEALKILRGEE